MTPWNDIFVSGTEVGQKWVRWVKKWDKSSPDNAIHSFRKRLLTSKSVGYLSNEYSQTILYILRLFSDYSQTILRPDKTRVDQPTVLVGWFSPSKIFQSIFGNPLTLWWKRNSSVGAHKTLSTRFCGYPCGMYRGTPKIAPECNFMDTHRLFHHHAEMHSVGVGCIPHRGVMGRGAVGGRSGFFSVSKTL